MNRFNTSGGATTNAVWGRGRLAVAFIGLCLISSAAFAEKPEWAGGGKPAKEAKEGRESKEKGKGGKPERDHGDRGGDSGSSLQAGPRVELRIGGYFGEAQRQAVQVYFGDEYRAGRCPPGLAKKNNGCLPPGQAKRYRVGQALPSDVIYHPVPASVVVQLGVPPAGHRYVRVAADILLIAVGTGLVVDAIADLGRL